MDALAPSAQIPNPAHSQGWWCTIKEADVDGDGNVDFLTPLRKKFYAMRIMPTTIEDIVGTDKMSASRFLQKVLPRHVPQACRCG